MAWIGEFSRGHIISVPFCIGWRLLNRHIAASGAWDSSTGGGDHARGNANRLPESGRDNRVMQIKGQIPITQSHWQGPKKKTMQAARFSLIHLGLFACRESPAYDEHCNGNCKPIFPVPDTDRANTLSVQALQALFISLALSITLLRCWVRLGIEHRALTISDYFIWAGWSFALGWFICSIIALRILIHSPPIDARLSVESVAYLKVCDMPSYVVCAEVI